MAGVSACASVPKFSSTVLHPTIDEVALPDRAREQALRLLEQNPNRLNRGDSLWTRMLIHASCWAEASRNGEISVEGFA